MAGKGGARPGAGRKTVAEEEKSRARAKAAITGKYGSIEKGLKALLDSGETSLIRFVFEHALGKPTENHNVDLGGTIRVTYDGGINDLIKPSS